MGQVDYAFAYAIDRGEAQQIKFQNALRHIGFEVKLKPYIQRKDGSAKGDWDVGITVDALTFAPKLDRLVLLSGDGDFDILVRTLIAEHNLVVDVISVEQLTAASLIAASSNYYSVGPELLLT